MRKTALSLLAHPDDRVLFNETLATLTGGSGAAAILLTRGDASIVPRVALRVAANHHFTRDRHGPCRGPKPLRWRERVLPSKGL